MTITDSLVTVADVVAYHGKNMDTVTNKLGAARYSTAQLEAIINQMIRFVYANSPSDITSEAQLYAVYELCKMEFNNRMIDDEILMNWKHVNIDIDTLQKIYSMMAVARKIWVV